MPQGHPTGISNPRGHTELLTSSPESTFPPPHSLPSALASSTQPWIGLHLPTLSITKAVCWFCLNISKIPLHFCHLHSCHLVLDLLSPLPWTVPARCIVPSPQTQRDPHKAYLPHLMPCRPLTRACRGLALPSKAHPIFVPNMTAALVSSGARTGQGLSHLQAFALAFPCPIRPQEGISPGSLSTKAL